MNVSALTRVAMTMAIGTASFAYEVGERWPTEDHKKYPLVTSAPRNFFARTWHPHLGEPERVTKLRPRFAEFWPGDYPAPNAAGDETRYFSALGGTSRLVPRPPTRELSADEIRDRHGYEVVFDSKGRVKTIFEHWKDGPREWTHSVIYEDDKHTIVISPDRRARWGGGGSVSLSIMETAEPRADEDKPAQTHIEMIFDLHGDPVYYSHSRNRAVVERIRRFPPGSYELEAGRRPCQARRYQVEAMLVSDDDALTHDQWIEAMFTIASLQPDPDEEATGWDEYGYDDLRDDVLKDIAKRGGKVWDAMAAFLDDPRIGPQVRKILRDAGHESVVPTIPEERDGNSFEERLRLCFDLVQSEDAGTDEFKRAVRSVGGQFHDIAPALEASPATFSKIRLFENTTGFDGIRFRAPDDPRISLFWACAFPDGTIGHWYILPAQGHFDTGFFRPKWHRHLYDDVPWPDEYRFFSQRHAHRMIPGEEHLLWFASKNMEPVDVYISVKLYDHPTDVSKQRGAEKIFGLKRRTMKAGNGAP